MASGLNSRDENVALLDEDANGRDESVDLSRRTLLGGFLLLHSIHHKEFKPKYFRARGDDTYPELLFNAHGDSKFPLYWTENPNGVKRLSETALTELERLDVNLLRSYCPVSCHILLEKEENKGEIDPYIEKMPPKNESFVPQMNSKALRAFSRAGKRKNEATISETVAVNNTIHIDGDNDDHLGKTTLTSPAAQNTDLVPSSSTRPPPGTNIVPQWWQWFQGYEGKPGSEVTSIFDRRFSRDQVVKDHLCKPDDRIRIGKKIKDLMNKLSREKKLNEDLRKIGDELKILQEKVQNLSLEKGKLESDFTSLKKAKDDLVIAKDQQAKSLHLTERLSKKRKKDRQTDIHNLKVEIAFQYEQGFEKTIEQTKILYPDLALEDLGAHKIVQDGKLVDPPEDDE
ncbi:hypothetical protein SESBI_22305 [Sesbania bispinosa]|nr:hypothetical protein SESBI_22305 [Sesbania bispinosa]